MDGKKDGCTEQGNKKMDGENGRMDGWKEEINEIKTDRWMERKEGKWKEEINGTKNNGWMDGWKKG